MNLFLIRSLWPWLLMTALLVGCGGAREAGEQDRTPRPEVQEGLTLATPSPTVRSIQLFRSGDETQLPIVTIGSGVTLTLAFDVMEQRGRPLSVYFYHANRSWRRDLVPAEYLTSFQRDDLLDYTPSRGTDIRYVHYRYLFPNRNIDFEISGNFIIRVTEQGMEEDVLFERAFFVTEQATGLEIGVDNVMIAGQGYPSVVPLVRFTPPSNLQSNVYDFNVCFVRNGLFTESRCTDRPTLAQQPALQYYLEPEEAFEPRPAEYFLDIGSLRVGSRIEQTDLTQSPFRLYLEPDYARFPGSGLDPLLNGQAVIQAAVRDVPDPGEAGEYAQVRFSFVPLDEQPLRGDVVVAGSFNGWRVEPENRLTWVGARGRYEGDVLLKQGRYEYRYMLTDPAARRALVGAAPRPENMYNAFVYYNDIRINTDRLLVVNAILAR